MLGIYNLLCLSFAFAVRPDNERSSTCIINDSRLLYVFQQSICTFSYLKLIVTLEIVSELPLYYFIMVYNGFSENCASFASNVKDVTFLDRTFLWRIQITYFNRIDFSGFFDKWAIYFFVLIIDLLSIIISYIKSYLLSNNSDAKCLSFIKEF